MRVIGLMSGTSGDGIDVAVCDIDGAPPDLQATIVKAWSVPYEPEFRQRIFHACEQGSAVEICRLNMELGERFVAAIGDYAAWVDLIGSHGQTIWHDVDADGRVTSTLQIGAAGVIAERTGVTTISNFRERDVAAGGQGAPLTAYVDWLLLRHPQHWRAVQNIGGMGNVTFLPPLKDTESTMLAFDTGPGNALIDAAMLHLTGKPYDQDGMFATGGQVDDEWLKQMLKHPYFQQSPPRTTGRELFGTQKAKSFIAEGQARGLTDQDIIATLTAFTSHSIAEAYHRFAPTMPQEVILGGGGSHNKALVAQLNDLLPADVMTHEAVGLDSDFKEALVFAVLAYETWHGRVGCLPEQTGARHASILGQITPGTNYTALIRRTWG
ncbi:MAG: anhydro-N-acetylmuramic acid kinase [Chloroflexi bacterium]|nr:MAG: anhydro-N-acetylmuramic acid kinase [Chloroflexota bacterium]